MADIPCVGAVVFDARGRLLLVKRANPPAQGRWSLPGGRMEAGESAEQGVIREVAEETGLDVRVEREVGTVHRLAPSGDTYVIRDFLCMVASVGADGADGADGAVIPDAADDAADAGFFALEEIGDLPTSDGLLEALREWDLL